MSEEAKEKKVLKKKPSSKKEIKEEGKKKGKSTPSKKSSVAGSKKAESPSASREDLPSDNPLTDKDKEKTAEENPSQEQITPNFPMRPATFPPQPPPYAEYLPPKSGPEGYPPRYQTYQPQRAPKPVPVRTCAHHNQPLKYYCEACEEPICDDCHSLGPHNTELHRVATLQEAFNARYNYLSSGTYRTLLEKRDKLLAQLDKIDYRIAEIRSVSSIVERDIKTEYAGMLERLKSAEGVKYAVLQHDMAEVQKDIERIDSICDALDEYLQGDQRGDYVGFLIKFRELHEYLEYAITKPFKVKIDVVPNDLPRELTEKRKMLERAEQCENLLKLKDDIIWNLIQEKKKLLKLAEIDLDKAAQQEWNEWAKLIEKFCEELMKYQLVCSYCGCALDDLTANSACTANIPAPPHIPEARHTLDPPPADSKGNGRHYFGKPVKQAEAYLAKLMVDARARSAFNNIKDGGREKLAELRHQLGEVDREGRDELGLGEFKEAVVRIYAMDDDNAAQLAGAFSNQTTKRVQYKQLLQHLEGLPRSPEVPKRYMEQSQEVPAERRGAFHDLVTRTDKDEAARKVIDSIRDKHISKDDLIKRFEKRDEAKKGTVTMDGFYLVMMGLGFVISNQEIETVARVVNPDAERTGEINYADFVNKIL